MKNFIRILAATALFASPLACDSGTPDAKKVAAKPDGSKPDGSKPDGSKVDTKTPAVKPEVKTPDPKPEDQPPAQPNPADVKIQLAALLAKEISGAPDKADEILGKHGLDRNKLDALIFEIAGDPDLTRRYMEARAAAT